MKSDNASFCVMPWIHMNVNPDGVATLCFQSHHRIHDGDGQDLNLQTRSLQKIWNFDGMKDIRPKIWAPEQFQHFDTCYENAYFFGTRTGYSGLQQHIQSAFHEMDTTDFANGDRPDRIVNVMHFINDSDTCKWLSFRLIAPVFHESFAAEIGHWAERTRYA